jgi:hypothetical protein
LFEARAFRHPIAPATRGAGPTQRLRRCRRRAGLVDPDRRLRVRVPEHVVLNVRLHPPRSWPPTVIALQKFLSKLIENGSEYPGGSA